MKFHRVFRLRSNLLVFFLQILPKQIYGSEPFYKCKFVFVCLVALRPKSTDMVMAGRSVHLTTLFPGQAGTSG